MFRHLKEENTSVTSGGEEEEEEEEDDKKGERRSERIRWERRRRKKRRRRKRRRGGILHTRGASVEGVTLTWAPTRWRWPNLWTQRQPQRHASTYRLLLEALAGESPSGYYPSLIQLSSIHPASTHKSIHTSIIFIHHPSFIIHPSVMHPHIHHPSVIHYPSFIILHIFHLSIIHHGSKRDSKNKTNK